MDTGFSPFNDPEYCWRSIDYLWFVSPVTAALHIVPSRNLNYFDESFDLIESSLAL